MGGGEGQLSRDGHVYSKMDIWEKGRRRRGWPAIHAPPPLGLSSIKFHYFANVLLFRDQVSLLFDPPLHPTPPFSSSTHFKIPIKNKGHAKRSITMLSSSFYGAPNIYFTCNLIHYSTKLEGGECGEEMNEFIFKEPLNSPTSNKKK